jgi:hypothetical protein
MYKCKCGCTFDEILGKYGCPNCLGKYVAKLTSPKTSAPRKERKMKANKGWTVSTVSNGKHFVINTKDKAYAVSLCKKFADRGDVVTMVGW